LISAADAENGLRGEGVFCIRNVQQILPLNGPKRFTVNEYSGIYAKSGAYDTRESDNFAALQKRNSLRMSFYFTLKPRKQSVSSG
jgi:hypothetical protein